MKSRGPDLTAEGYRRIIVLLITLVILPGGFLSAVGVWLLFNKEASTNILFGILVLIFCGLLAAGVSLVWVFLARERDLHALQADFISKVSHELRTPLTSIRMFAETLKLRSGDPAVERQCVDALDRESLRLQALIDRLLDWGRMESGHRQYTLSPTPLAEVVHEALGVVQPILDREGAVATVDLPAEGLVVQADHDALLDALVNLLGNALKYTSPPQRIDVRAAKVGDGVELSISDNGPGIAKGEHRRIFQKFYRSDDLLARSRDGSGLGLAIVDHIARGHRGAVTLKSELGKGSTFTLHLLAATEAPP